MGAKTSRWWTFWGFLILAWAAFPLLWMVSLSFKDPNTFRSSTPSFFPSKWVTTNYHTVFSDSLFTSALRNSIGIAVIATGLSVVVTIPVMIIVLVFQRRIVAGLTAGAVKG